MNIGTSIEKIIDKMQNAFAYHKVIYDDNNIPIDFEYIYVNDAFEELTGLKKKNVIGSRVTELIPNIKESSFDWIGYYGNISEKQTEDHIEQYFDLWDRWYRIDVFSPEKGHFATLFNDITDIKRITESLREQKEVLKQITENLEEATFLQDVKTKELIYASRAFEKLYEVSLEDLKSKPDVWKSIVHPDDIEKVYKKYNMENTIKEINKKGVFIEKFRVLSKTGKTKWIKSKFLPIKNQEGEVVRIVGIEQDITKDIEVRMEIVRQKVRAEKLAMYDFLTNIYNRRAFFDRARQECLRAKREGHNMVIVMTDIDKFKSVNDTYGHDIGDIVLKDFATKLRGFIRDYDVVARFGGEEFIILLTDISLENAYKRVEMLRKSIEESNLVIGNKINIKYTSSFGIAEIKCTGPNPFEDAIKEADNALYRAKNKGRNRVEVEL